MLLADLADVSAAVAADPARSRKVALIAEALRRAAPEERPVVVTYLSGELRQRRTGVGWATLRDGAPPAELPSLTVGEVDATFEALAALAGAGSAAQRRRLVGGLMARATGDEQRFVVGLVSGELRQGAQEGVMVDAVARASGVPVADVRRAVMLAGALPPVAAAAMAEGAAGLARFRLRVGQPLQPMLAQTATSVEGAVERLGEAAVDWKLDGVRVQVHRDGDDVAVFTRTLDDITARVPEVAAATLALPARSVVLDGEVIALRADGRPRPFQETASRVASRTSVERLRAELPLTAYVFDVLHLDGADLLDRPARERFAAAEAALPPPLRVPRVITGDPAAAGAALADALAHGHEGVVVKSLDAPYEAGRRGAGWLKVKPVHALDLVVLAAEWGHGRRKGWLSNLHLGARDPSDGSFVMLGKTFKGMTDELLRWQTEQLLGLATSPTDHWVVHVRPELVVEVAFDGVQTSPRYPAGMALRFARVLRYRPDKRAADADTVDAVRAVHLR
ncbi:MAG: ATP-dependent DNA ligase [Frankiaceae bacterium]